MCYVQILWNLADRKSVKPCVTYLTKQNNISPGSPILATARIVPKIFQGHSPTLYSECSMFYPNRFTFGRVIAKCANTINTRHKVNPIFGWCLASSPIIILKSLHTSLAQPAFLCNFYAFFWCTHCYHSTADSTAAVSDLYCEPNHCK